MKIMIAYDGSTYADAALDDLRRAGLPGEVEALVVTIAEGMLPSDLEPEFAGSLMITRALSTGRLIREQAQANAVEAEANVARATNGLRASFPRWLVAGEVLRGAPAEAVIRRAEEYGADLIVVGSRGHSAVGRFFLGSVSEKVVTEACCPVRVGRLGAGRDDGVPPRIIVGVDGSPGAMWAVRAAAMRAWPDGTGVRLVVVDDGSGPTRITDIRPRLEELGTGGNEGPPVNARLMAEGARALLHDGGLSVTVEVREGDPRRVLLDEARAWAADSVFVGSYGLDHVDGGLGLGRVSAALVTNATCSVEVVR